MTELAGKPAPLAYLMDGEVFYPEPGDETYFATAEGAQPIFSSPNDPHGLQALREALSVEESAAQKAAAVKAAIATMNAPGAGLNGGAPVVVELRVAAMRCNE